MYTLLILFFASLIGIVFMIGRKLKVVASNEMLENENVEFFVFDFQHIRHITLSGLRKIGVLLVIEIIRLYVKSANFLKNRFEDLKNIRKSRMSNISPDEQKISKFLKVISEYKHKIRDIKEKIKEEENL